MNDHVHPLIKSIMDTAKFPDGTTLAQALESIATPREDDRIKVRTFAGVLRDMARVKLNDEPLSDAIWSKVNELADWCDGQAERLR